MPNIYGEGKDPIPAIDQPTVIFIMKNRWTLSSSESEIYEATRASWKSIDKVRDRAVFALGLANGVVRGAYRIKSWYPDANQNGRWIFEGEPTPELDAVGKSAARLRRAQGGAFMFFENGISSPDLE